MEIGTFLIDYIKKNLGRKVGGFENKLREMKTKDHAEFVNKETKA